MCPIYKPFYQRHGFRKQNINRYPLIIIEKLAQVTRLNHPFGLAASTRHIVFPFRRIKPSAWNEILVLRSDPECASAIPPHHNIDGPLSIFSRVPVTAGPFIHSPKHKQAELTRGRLEKPTFRRSNSKAKPRLGGIRRQIPKSNGAVPLQFPRYGPSG